MIHIARNGTKFGDKPTDQLVGTYVSKSWTLILVCIGNRYDKIFGHHIGANLQCKLDDIVVQDRKSVS